MRRLDGHHGTVLSLGYLAGGHLLAPAGQDGTVRLWDVFAGIELARITPGLEVRRPDRTPPSSDELATGNHHDGGNDDAPRHGRPEPRPDPHRFAPYAVAAVPIGIDALATTPNGIRLATLRLEQRSSVVRAWDVVARPDPDTGDEVADFDRIATRPVHENARDLDICSDGKTILVAAHLPGERLVALDLEAGRDAPPLEVTMPTRGLERVRVAPGDRFAIGRVRGTKSPGSIRPFRLDWEGGHLRAMEPLAPLDLPTRPRREVHNQGRRAIPHSARFADQRRLLFFADGWSATSICDLRVWETDLEAEAPRWQLRTHLDGLASRVTALDLSPDGHRVALATMDGRLRISALEDGHLGAGYDSGLGRVHAIRFAPDGLTLATAGEGGMIIWDADLM